MLKELCGKDDCKNVTFVTTMWDEVSEEDGSEREQILECEFWRAMIRDPPLNTSRGLPNLLGK